MTNNKIIVFYNIIIHTIWNWILSIEIIKCKTLLICTLKSNQLIFIHVLISSDNE